MIQAILQLALGMVVLFGSAEVLVRAAVHLAQIFRIPPLVIGMTVIAFGTSAPELVVTVDAALAGAPGLAIGNVIGSNIANVLLIIGCCCVLSPIRKIENVHRRDGIMLTGGTVVFVALCAQGAIGVGSGAVLLVLFAAFLVSTYRLESGGDAAAIEHMLEVEEIRPLPWPTGAVAAVTAVSLVGLVGGAHLTVLGAVSIARGYGISEETIGLTVIALGTSLPELAASAVAAYRGQSAIAVGNVVGSNLFNILAIAGIAALVAPLPVGGRIMAVDVWVMLGATALMLPILARRWRPGRRSGIALLALYGAYIAFNLVDAGLVGG